MATLEERVTALEKLPKIVAQGHYRNGPPRRDVYQDSSSILSFKEIMRPSPGVFIFKYTNQTPGLSVFVASTGIAGPNNHTDVVPVVRSVSETEFVINLIVYNDDKLTTTGYINKDSDFRYIVVQGLGVGYSGPVKEG